MSLAITKGVMDEERKKNPNVETTNPCYFFGVFITALVGGLLWGPLLALAVGLSLAGGAVCLAGLLVLAIVGIVGVVLACIFAPFVACCCPGWGKRKGAKREGHLEAGRGEGGRSAGDDDDGGVVGMAEQPWTGTEGMELPSYPEVVHGRDSK